MEASRVDPDFNPAAFDQVPKRVPPFSSRAIPMTLPLIIPLNANDYAAFRPPATATANIFRLSEISANIQLLAKKMSCLAHSGLVSPPHPSDSAVPPEISAAHLQLNRTPIPKKSPRIFSGACMH